MGKRKITPDRGQKKFAKSDYDKALMDFRDIILDADSRSAWDALYWTALSYLALNQYRDAEKT